MHSPNPSRYDDSPQNVPYRRVGRSGLQLPVISLGLWQNFGEASPLAAQKDLVLRAFDRGVTHFDLANNYGPPPGSAEKSFGEILRTDLRGYRDELVVSTKAGYNMWPGPYGEGGSRKYLLSSLDQSLNRLGLDYVDIFYSHRFDPETPLEETMGALKTAVDSGRALYAGISSYSASRTLEAFEVARGIGLNLLIHQPSYSLLNRWIEEPDASGMSLTDVCAQEELGVIGFSPLAQGLLTSKYLTGQIPAGSRASANGSFKKEYVSEENVAALRVLNEIASARGQSLAQMAISWSLRDEVVTSAVVGARTTEQLDENLDAARSLTFTPEELKAIDAACVDGGLNLWASRSSDL
ncbi:L-glyceraldehyde 3-phosphate reductase [Timonella senegalensis]|uniref:L-glyceraldehyde 3-phosphate reductase n=2 Tax=Timonella senegalensis TaxID=1465825 RepID=UPI0028A586BF|nr:L-glyceraldehyde 3-phosphate reductase [Timonella senegalensis]